MFGDPPVPNVLDEKDETQERTPNPFPDPDKSFLDEELNKRFGPNVIKQINADTYVRMHRAYLEMADILDAMLPEGRAKSLAFTELENSSMWADRALTQD